MTWSVPSALLVCVLSYVDYDIGKRLGATEDPSQRKHLLWISLGSNLGVLGAFKYTNFVLANLSVPLQALGIAVPVLQYEMALPPGISYFTFAGLSYVIDIYYGRQLPCTRAREYFLYIVYFPKVLAGPIVRAREFLPQLRLRPSAVDVETGLVYFAIGLAKKAIISDQIAPNVDVIFANPGQFDALTLLQGMLGYSAQIYCDFSGYSDMAIGSARIIGFKLPENFQMPYSSTTITEFWRRWHITLSNWFRDYVFVPLEIAARGNRYPTLQGSANLIVTMLLCGLWHGPSWTFVFWGALHGIALAIHRMWTVSRPRMFRAERGMLSSVWTAVSRAMTLGVVMIGWVIFRSSSPQIAFEFLSRMFTWQRDGTQLISPYILPAVATLFLLHLVIDKDRNLAQELPFKAAPMRIAMYSVLVFLIAVLGAADASPFIYFQF